MSSYALRIFLLAGLCGLLSACDPVAPLGELVGEYAVVGTLVDNTCGAGALPLPNPLTFHAELRHNQGVGLWYLEEPTPVSGVLTDEGSFAFEAQASHTVIDAGERMVVEDEGYGIIPADYRTEVNLAGCTLQVHEVISGTVFAVDSNNTTVTQLSAGESDLTGENQISIAPTGDSDCAAAHAREGGPFIDLPCSAEFELTGTLLTASIE